MALTSSPHDPPAPAALAAPGVAELVAFVQRSRRLVVLSGAGCSTESGIPDYRDEHGEWKHRRPVQYQHFVASAAVRRRYWARSLVGWERIARAAPNAAHAALARLEAAGRVHCLITQNVDGLHQRAGSRRVIDLHGRLDTVHCLACGTRVARGEFQHRLQALNPGWSGPAASAAPMAPDGDADLEEADYDAFRVPECGGCRGVFKPAVVFFGENVPRDRVADAMARVGEGDALLVVGSSLMVWSGLRFVRAAADGGIPVAAVNRGRTRADDLISLKVSGSCGEVLTALVGKLGIA